MPVNVGDVYISLYVKQILFLVLTHSFRELLLRVLEPSP